MERDALISKRDLAKRTVPPKACAPRRALEDDGATEVTRAGGRSNTGWGSTNLPR
jgi:hypothetical protein